MALQTLSLEINASYGRGRLSGGPGPIVSLTSHGSRLRRCHLAIASIGRGRLRPERLILWVNDESALQNPSRQLSRLQSRGLEIILTQNYGPHTKYFPYVMSHVTHTQQLVTADDDIVYDSRWLERLVESARRSPEVIHAYRARRVRMVNETGFQPYAQWGFSEHAEPSYGNFGTGHSGVIYPPRFLNFLRDRGSDFLQSCRRADDVWLHNCAVRSEHPVALVGTTSRAFNTVAFTQTVGLKHANVAGGENDTQILATYSEQDYARVASSLRAEEACR